MIKLVSKGYFYEDKIGEAIKLYEVLVKESKKEKGCLAYNLFQDKNDKTILTMIEEWKSDDCLEYHKNSDHFKKLVPIISTFRKKAELNIYELVL